MFQWTVARDLKLQHPSRKLPFSGRIALEADLYFKDGRHDLDNAMKTLIDQVAAWFNFDDKSVYEITLRKHVDRSNPRTMVTLRPMD